MDLSAGYLYIQTEKLVLKVKIKTEFWVAGQLSILVNNN